MTRKILWKQGDFAFMGKGIEWTPEALAIYGLIDDQEYCRLVGLPCIPRIPQKRIAGPGKRLRPSS